MFSVVPTGGSSDPSKVNTVETLLFVLGVSPAMTSALYGFYWMPQVI
jgi:hypothetical protein